MKLTKIRSCFVLSLLGCSISAFAADPSAMSTQAPSSSSQPTLEQLAENIKSACSKDINKFCSDITPGNGRIAACLDSKQDKLSSNCRTNWVGAKANVSQRMDRAEVAFRKSCGADVQKFCSDVSAGKGRILDCLGHHKDGLSNSCSSFQAKLEKQLSDFLG